MLSMLSVEFDSPGWEVIPVLWPEPPSMYASCADSVLLWAVMDMKGLEGVVRGGTGGGVFLYVVMHDDTAKKNIQILNFVKLRIKKLNLPFSSVNMMSSHLKLGLTLQVVHKKYFFCL